MLPTQATKTALVICMIQSVSTCLAHDRTPELDAILGDKSLEAASVLGLSGGL